MNTKDLIVTIVGIVVGALFVGYLITMACEYQVGADKQMHDKRMREYELMERQP